MNRRNANLYLLVGAIASATFMGASAAAAVPETAAKTWLELYSRGANIMPKVAGLTSLLLGYSAYEARRQSGKWKGYVVALVSVMAIVPWTLIAMKRTNASLTTAAKAGPAANKEKVTALIRKWNALNLVRSSFPLLGTIFALRTFLSNFAAL